MKPVSLFAYGLALMPILLALVLGRFWAESLGQYFAALAVVLIVSSACYLLLMAELNLDFKDDAEDILAGFGMPAVLLTIIAFFGYLESLPPPPNKPHMSYAVLYGMEAALLALYGFMAIGLLAMSIRQALTRPRLAA